MTICYETNLIKLIFVSLCTCIRFFYQMKRINLIRSEAKLGEDPLHCYNTLYQTKLLGICFNQSKLTIYTFSRYDWFKFSSNLYFSFQKNIIPLTVRNMVNMFGYTDRGDAYKFMYLSKCQNIHRK